MIYSRDPVERAAQIAFKMREFYEENREGFIFRLFNPYPEDDHLMIGLLRIALSEAEKAAKQDEIENQNRATQTVHGGGNG